MPEVVRSGINKVGLTSRGTSGPEAHAGWCHRRRARWQHVDCDGGTHDCWAAPPRAASDDPRPAAAPTPWVRIRGRGRVRVRGRGRGRGRDRVRGRVRNRVGLAAAPTPLRACRCSRAL